MSRRTLFCEKLTGDTRSLIWTDSRTDQDTGTVLAIPAQHPGLTCSRKHTLFASTVLAAVITVTAKYLSFVGSTMHGAQGWPAMPNWFPVSSNITTNVHYACTCIYMYIYTLYLFNPFNSNFNFLPCRLHPASNGNSISESHPEYEGHAHHHYVIT